MFFMLVTKYFDYIYIVSAWFPIPYHNVLFCIITIVSLVRSLFLLDKRIKMPTSVKITTSSSYPALQPVRQGSSYAYVVWICIIQFCLYI